MTYTSEQIKKDVVDQLFWDNRVNAADINVDVKGRHVSLLGSVPSYYAMQSAVNDAWSVRGVQSVDDQIDVNYQLEENRDESIRSHLNNVLLWDPEIDSTNINISVNDSIVTLEGSTDTFWKKLRIEDHATAITGVLGIRNLIVVVPSHDVTDEEIANQIQASLERNVAVEPANINIRVENRVVTLAGSVSDRIAEIEAVNTAMFTQGVIDVIDELVIQ